MKKEEGGEKDKNRNGERYEKPEKGRAAERWNEMREIDSEAKGVRPDRGKPNNEKAGKLIRKESKRCVGVRGGDKKESEEGTRKGREDRDRS